MRLKHNALNDLNTYNLNMYANLFQKHEISYFRYILAVVWNIFVASLAQPLVVFFWWDNFLQGHWVIEEVDSGWVGGWVWAQLILKWKVNMYSIFKKSERWDQEPENYIFKERVGKSLKSCPSFNLIIAHYAFPIQHWFQDWFSYVGFQTKSYVRQVKKLFLTCEPIFSMVKL